MGKKKYEPETYWELRSIAQEEVVKQRADSKLNVLAKSYKQAERYLTSEIKKIYDSFIRRTGTTDEEVARLMQENAEPSVFVELGQMAKTIENKEVSDQVAAYLTKLSVKGRVTRLEQMKAKAYVTAKRVADKQMREMTDFYVEEIYNRHDETVVEAEMIKLEQEIDEQFPKNNKLYSVNDDKIEIEVWSDKIKKPVEVIDVADELKNTKIKGLTTRQVQNVLDTRWVGSNYSKRIWNDTDKLAARLQELFTVEKLTGMSEDEMARAIAKEFDTNLYVAKRLIRTEANFITGQAQLKAWKERGIEHYILVVTLDLRTSEICKAKDEEQKVYKVEEAIVNGEKGNYPPFHPWCRTTVRAYFGSRTLRGARTANNPITNETFVITNGTKYSEWENELIKRHSKETIAKAKKEIRRANARNNKRLIEQKVG